MSDPVVSDAAVEAALDAWFGETWRHAMHFEGLDTAEDRTAMRRTLLAALPHLVAERDAEIARLRADDDSRHAWQANSRLNDRLAERDAEIARLTKLIAVLGQPNE